MHLSKIFIEWQGAKDPYQLHRALWKLFPEQPDATRDYLFRVERSVAGRGAEVLLMSAQEPTSCVVSQVLATKPYQLAIPDATPLRFRLRANPIKTIKDAEGRRNGRDEIKSCRVPLLDEEQQREWLVRKFVGIAELTTLVITPERPLFFRKEDRQRKQTMAGKIQPVLFEGVLRVSDAGEFSKLVAQGIGPAKSMGCGLLTLARA